MVERSPLTAENSNVGVATPTPAARSPLEAGRLGVYTALGATVAIVPFPWIPEALTKRIRGALAHDVAARRGLSLSREARDVLSEPSDTGAPRGVVSQVLRFAGMRLAARMFTRLGPVGMMWPVQYGLRTYVLGRMLDRYLERWRTERAVRIDVAEARRVRHAIDGALARALTVQVAPAEEPTPVDDQRDPTTALVDALIGIAAGVPERLLRRLDTAFDELVGQADG
jgi:hypothetical protein